MYQRFFPAYSEMFAAAFNKSIYFLQFYRDQQDGHLNNSFSLLINQNSAPMFFWEMMFTEKQQKQKNVISTVPQPVVVETNTILTYKLKNENSMP